MDESKLALAHDEHGAWARVDDTGVGIDQADLPRVFDVAYRGSNGRVPRTDSSLPSGSGLGLAIAAGLVQAHGGTLSARNLDDWCAFRGSITVGRQLLTAFSELRRPDVDEVLMKKKADQGFWP